MVLLGGEAGFFVAVKFMLKYRTFLLPIALIVMQIDTKLNVVEDECGDI